MTYILCNLAREFFTLVTFGYILLFYGTTVLYFFTANIGFLNFLFCIEDVSEFLLQTEEFSTKEKY